MMQTMFLGKPLTYWTEIDTIIKRYIIDEKLFAKIVLENNSLRTENNKLKERLRIIKDITENGCYPEFDKLLEECESENTQS